MSTFRFLSKSTEETIKFGSLLAKHLKCSDIVCLFGELGSGKTTLVKGIAEGLRVNPNAVCSPTFVLMNVYEGKLPLYHFDFYRLQRTEEIIDIGYDEFLYGQGVSVVEWADRFGNLMPEESLHVILIHKGENEREIRIKGMGTRYKKLSSAL